VCRRHGVSREIYYRYRRRYLVQGLGGLEDRSRAPIRSPGRIDATVETQIRQMRTDRGGGEPAGSVRSSAPRNRSPGGLHHPSTGLCGEANWWPRGPLGSPRPSGGSNAWWNLENLFDYENSPRRTDKLRRALGADIAGWTPRAPGPQDRPARVCDRPDARGYRPRSPRDFRGGEPVRGQPAGHSPYQAPPSSPLLGRPRRHPGWPWDRRGLPLRPSLLHGSGGRAFQHVVIRRTATREIFQVNFNPPGTDVDDPGEPLAIA
jgi:hypothetical protein